MTFVDGRGQCIWTQSYLQHILWIVAHCQSCKHITSRGYLYRMYILCIQIDVDFNRNWLLYQGTQPFLPVNWCQNWVITGTGSQTIWWWHILMQKSVHFETTISTIQSLVAPARYTISCCLWEAASSNLWFKNFNPTIQYNATIRVSWSITQKDVLLKSCIIFWSSDNVPCFNQDETSRWLGDVGVSGCWQDVGLCNQVFNMQWRSHKSAQKAELVFILCDFTTWNSCERFDSLVHILLLAVLYMVQLTFRPWYYGKIFQKELLACFSSEVLAKKLMSQACLLISEFSSSFATNSIVTSNNAAYSCPGVLQGWKVACNNLWHNLFHGTHKNFIQTVRKWKEVRTTGNWKTSGESLVVE